MQDSVFEHKDEVSVYKDNAMDLNGALQYSISRSNNPALKILFEENFLVKAFLPFAATLKWSLITEVKSVAEEGTRQHGRRRNKIDESGRKIYAEETWTHETYEKLMHPRRACPKELFKFAHDNDVLNV